MGKSVKSVKKFSKKHLGATIARRHKLKPMNNALRKKRDAQLSAGEIRAANSQCNVKKGFRIRIWNKLHLCSRRESVEVFKLWDIFCLIINHSSGDLGRT